MAKQATNFPAVEVGHASPYPTVVAVTINHQKDAGILVNGDGSFEIPSDAILTYVNLGGVVVSVYSHVPFSNQYMV
eukprot:CAMPEP_0197838526 /NCGR_PEP_ID=MMETSP1437-20131217/36904_1 /TAXON_ID=49252 ORGANISM="Eucampia antarctica, Strain CCMP1452" /NCGR_SAMPLE_ID=MMETSP1437 /ASSEMBLY_ACC=CAM_ASM_001096 /LENGTH=75 /DNA_ID=CAMNT_0043446569 /DNA_START=12 /DNA_END=235 /DNA_ORIENTATION=-